MVKRKTYFIHRLMVLTFLDQPIDINLTPNHINRIEGDNRINNLEWVTRSENNKHYHSTIKPTKDKILLEVFLTNLLQDNDIKPDIQTIKLITNNFESLMKLYLK